MKNISIICLIIFSFHFQNMIAQEQEKKALFSNEESTLFQWLWSCQSISYAILSKNNGQTQPILIKLGNNWYNYANQEFLKLQEDGLDEEAKEVISAFLLLYSKIFNESAFRVKPEAALALDFTKYQIPLLIEMLAQE